MAENKTIHRDYEGMFLFGTAATANVEEALNTVRGFIEKHGGSIRVLKKWDDRKLAYDVAKQQRGLYVLSYFNAPTTAVAAENLPMTNPSPDLKPRTSSRDVRKTMRIAK